MTRFLKSTLVATLAMGALGASVAMAGNGGGDQIRLQLRDGSCLDQIATLSATGDMTRDQIRLQLKDGSCLLDDALLVQSSDDTLATTLQVRTRTGEDNGKGNVERHRYEGGSKDQSGRK